MDEYIVVSPQYAEAVAPPHPKLPTRFTEDAYTWLLHEGRVLSYYGTREDFTHIHLLWCGLDLEDSEPVEAGTISQFTDTYSESEERPMVVGRATCRCRDVQRADLVHDPLPLGELFTRVSQFDLSSVTAVLPAGVVPGALVRSQQRSGGVFWSVEAQGEHLLLEPEQRLRGARRLPERVSPIVASHVFGPLEVIAPPRGWTR